MEVLIYVIGSFVFTVFMYCIPILTTLSIVLDWYGGIQVLCIVCAFIQFITVWSVLTERLDIK